MEHDLVYKDSEATTDVKPSMESPKLDETFKASPLVDELVNSVAAPVAIAVSEILHAKKGDNSASNTDQGSVVSDSIKEYQKTSIVGIVFLKLHGSQNFY